MSKYIIQDLITLKSTVGVFSPYVCYYIGDIYVIASCSTAFPQAIYFNSQWFVNYTVWIGSGRMLEVFAEKSIPHIRTPHVWMRYIINGKLSFNESDHWNSDLYRQPDYVSNFG